MGQVVSGAPSPTLEDLELDSREPNTPGDLVRRVRLFHGWTQEGFAALFNVSRRTIIRWEERGTFFHDPALDIHNHHARVWRSILVRYEAAKAYRLTDDGVVDLISECENARLDPVTFALRGALDALAKKRHT